MTETKGTRRLLRGALLSGVLLAAHLGTAASSVDQDFEAFGKRYVDQFPALDPVGATLLGDHRFDHELSEISAEARGRAAAFYRDQLEQLRRFPRPQLSRANQVDAALLEHELEAQLWSLEHLQEWAWNPLVYTGLAGNSLYGLVAREFAPLAERLDHMASRLEQFPRFFEQVRATLDPKRVPKVHAETAVKQNRGVLSILDEMVKPRLGEAPRDLRQRLEQAMQRAGEAVQRQQQWLEQELLPQAAGDFRIGRELYEQKLAFTLHTPQTPQEIRRRAESELRRVREQMYQVAREIYRQQYPYNKFPEAPGEAYQQAIIRAALEVAYQQLPERGAIVETAKRQLAQATAFVREKNLVSVPSDPVDIIIMPEFQRGVSIAYCDSPGPLDVGQKTFYAVAPLPEEWSEEQVRSFLREYNLWSLQNLTVHEAMPGHYLQIAHSNRYPSTLRAVLASGVFIEGWAVYAERLMVDAGYPDGNPLMRLIVLKWYLRSITNALMDQAIHAGEMSRDEAMQLMIEGGFQEEREAAAKWVRAQLTSAQLSTYFVGYQAHADLRAEAEKSWDKDFSLKKYHDTLLSFGSPAVQFVRALLLDLPIPGQPEGTP